MSRVFTTIRQVEFSETDMAGIAHFSNYFKWMEATEHLFLQQQQIPLIEVQNSKTYAWPRINVSCNYKAPLFLQDKVEIELVLESISKHKVTYSFKFYRLIPNSEKIHVATGEMTTVFASTPPLTRAPIPEAIQKKLNYPEMTSCNS